MLLPHRVLPAQATADADFVQIALELVDGEHAHLVLGLESRDFFAGIVAHHFVGVAALQLPAGGDFA